MERHSETRESRILKKLGLSANEATISNDWINISDLERFEEVVVRSKARKKLVGNGVGLHFSFMTEYDKSTQFWKVNLRLDQRNAYLEKYDPNKKIKIRHSTPDGWIYTKTNQEERASSLVTKPLRYSQ